MAVTPYPRSTTSPRRRPGEFVCLLGASGCGKSTCSTCWPDSTGPTSGEVRVAGRSALMFQESALYPWLTVARNVELALRLRGVRRAERRERAHELLRMVSLDDFTDKRPHELSGGMRQRTALARAFAQDAEVLLMDEPFGALDAMTRDLLHAELEQLWSDKSLTIVFVTHNVRGSGPAGRPDRAVYQPARSGGGRDPGPDRPAPAHGGSRGLGALREITERLREEVRRHARD